MSNRHTPGPWKFYTDAGDRHIASELKPSLSLMCDAKYYPWCPDHDADWHLIAAAPELFQAAEQFLASVKDGNVAELIDYYADIFGEAVAKATGSTP